MFGEFHNIKGRHAAEGQTIVCSITFLHPENWFENARICNQQLNDETMI